MDASIVLSGTTERWIFPVVCHKKWFCFWLWLTRTPTPGNPFYKVSRIKELSSAAINFMIRSSHKDGTCDDYFPYERAMGALVFSLYAASEAYLILGMSDQEIANFFIKRVRHLEKENESGRLGNHQALAALAAYNVYIITGDEKALNTANDDSP